MILTMVISLGSIPHIWGSTLFTVSLSELQITQEFIGYITSICLLGSTTLTVLVARLADLSFTMNLKHLIVLLLPFHVMSMICLGKKYIYKAFTQVEYHVSLPIVIMFQVYLPQLELSKIIVNVRIIDIHITTNNIMFDFYNFNLIPTDEIGVSYIVGISTLNAVTPLMMEMASEISYPIKEDIIGGIINQANNFVGVIFYLLYSYVVNIRALLYILMILPSLTFIAFFFVKESYNRRLNSQMYICT